MSDLRVPLVAVLVVLAAFSLFFAGGASAQSDSVTLTLSVEDRSGSPVGNARVSVTWDEDGGPKNVTTLSNGKRFVDVPRGANVTLTVHHEDYVRNRPVEVTNATEQTVSIGVAEQGRANVTVRDPSGPLANARVRLYHSGNYVVDARTDDSGRLLTRPIEQGQYTLIAYKQGYRRNRTVVSVGERLNRTLTVERDSVLVRFNVTDDHFSPPRPLPNASVELDRMGSVTTLSDGRASVSAPVNTPLSVTVTKEGYETETLSPSINENERTIDVTLRRTPELDVAAANSQVVIGQTVRITVLDEYGTPVADASVTVGDEEVGTTDANGVVEVPVESEGNVTISASKGDLDASAIVRGVAAGEETDITETTDGETATTTTTQGETTTTGGPGFTVVVAAVAVVVLLMVTALLRQRG